MKSKPKTEYWNSSKLELLHLFSPAAAGLLEDARLDTDQNDQDANSAQMIVSK